MKAFTVRPVWAMFICNGVKDIENRSRGVRPPKGTAAVHVSSKYSRAEYEADMQLLRATPEQRAQLPYEAFAEMCGHVVGVVDYQVVESTASPWWDGTSVPIALSNARWIEPYVPCRGQLGFWRMPDEVAKMVSEPNGNREA